MLPVCIGAPAPTPSLTQEPGLSAHQLVWRWRATLAAKAGRQSHLWQPHHQEIWSGHWKSRLSFSMKRCGVHPPLNGFLNLLTTAPRLADLCFSYHWKLRLSDMFTFASFVCSCVTSLDHPAFPQRLLRSVPKYTRPGSCCFSTS